MKTKILIWIPVVLALCLMGQVNAAGEAAGTRGDAAIVIKDIQVPENIMPGDTFDLSFVLKNAWQSDVRETFVYLEGGYPILKISPTDPVSVGTLQGRYVSAETHPPEYYDPESRPLHFTLTVDKSATAGTYSVNAVLTYRRYSDAIGRVGASERYREVIPIVITVEGEPDIAVFVKGSKPQKIRAGDDATVNLKVVNMGTEEAKNVLLFTDSVDMVDVMWFSRVFYVGDIVPQGSGNAVLSVEVDSAARAGEYAMPVKISYETPDGEKITKDDDIAITIEKGADFEVSPVADLLESDTRENQVVFRVKNTGNARAEEARVTLKANYPFTPTGNEFYAGDIEPGEAVDVSFHVDVDSDASTQKYPVDLIVQWKEDETLYTKTKSSFIDVIMVESNWYPYLLAVIGIFILVLILRKLKKK